MKIAVFGDSFGIPVAAKKGKLWSDHLIDFGHTVDNYSERGTSLYYIYTLFLSKRALYDKIIFLIPHYKNIYVPTLKKHPHISDHDSVIRLLAKARAKGFDEEEIEVLKALDYNFKYLKNYNNIEAIRQDRTFHEALANNINDPNVLKIPTFPDSLYEVSCSLHDVHMIDINHYGLDGCDTKYKDKKRSFIAGDLRHGHLNPENNFILANKINCWINGQSFHININDFVTSDDPAETYFNLV